MSNRKFEQFVDRRTSLHGMNLCDIIPIWRKLGGSCQKGHRNGETIFTHPNCEHRIVVSRRRSSPRVLTRELTKLRTACGRVGSKKDHV